MSKLYVYLLRRDKKGMKLITTLNQTKECHPTRLPNPQILNLPFKWESEIEKIAHEHRMMWEPWLESAESYQGLRESLKKRGYSALPISPSSIMKYKTFMNVPMADTEKVPRQKTMLRKTKE